MALTVQANREKPLRTLYTYHDIADYMGLSHRAVRRWVRRFNIKPDLKVGHKFVRFKQASVDALVNACANRTRKGAK